MVKVRKGKNLEALGTAAACIGIFVDIAGNSAGYWIFGIGFIVFIFGQFK